ncbi:MAG: GDP-mannose 4,6-dehydratase [candidate division Zixibacteria bacterium]|nr:GDP-mannose 4,6-dehydratase [candidate division Zixibacteria bacterium]
MSKRVLITGINGFVGKHLTDYLLANNYKVTGFDLNNDMEDRIISRDIKIYTGDLRDEQEVAKVIKNISPNLIFHLAAQSSVKLSFENPVETLSINLIGSLNILEAVSKMETPAKTLLITSSEVYGQLKPDQVPVTENHPFEPVNPYAVSKAAVDLLAYQYYRAYKLPIYWARAFSHAGPYQRTVAVLSDWAFQTARIELGLSAPEIKVGNLDVTRDYIDVRDTIQAYIAILLNGKPGQPYNVCSGKGYRLSELLDIITSFSVKKIKVIPDPSRLRPVDIPILIGSPEKLKKNTGWQPKIEMDTTLRDIYNYWIEYLTPQIQ